MSVLPGPTADADVPAYVAALGLPGLADVHVHFLPESMQRKVWGYFADAEAHYGRAWPIHYPGDEQTRLATVRALGLRAIPALGYAHRPGMARWLNEWAGELADREPDVVRCLTFYPEPGAAAYVAEAVAAGARLGKVHVQVGGFAPDDPALDEAWGIVEDSRLPVVIHAGSGPLPGEHTGPAGVARLLARHPGLVLVVAHAGLPEYDAFADLAQEHAGVHLDTTMVGTDFTEAMNPMPSGYVARLDRLRDKVVLGSDFPSIPYPYAHQVEALARFGLGEDWLRAVLWDNGARLLGLDA